MQGELGDRISTGSYVIDTKITGQSKYFVITPNSTSFTRPAFIVSGPINSTSIGVCQIYSRGEFTWLGGSSSSVLTISGSCYSGTDPNNLSYKTNATYNLAIGKTVFIVTPSGPNSLSLNSYTSPPPTWMFVGYNCVFGV